MKIDNNTDDSGAADYTLETIFVPLVDVEGELMSQVGASANKQEYQGQERLEVE